MDHSRVRSYIREHGNCQQRVTINRQCYNGLNHGRSTSVSIALFLHYGSAVGPREPPELRLQSPPLGDCRGELSCRWNSRVLETQSALGADVLWYLVSANPLRLSWALLRLSPLYALHPYFSMFSVMPSLKWPQNIGAS